MWEESSLLHLFTPLIIRLNRSRRSRVYFPYRGWWMRQRIYIVLCNNNKQTNKKERSLRQFAAHKGLLTQNIQKDHKINSPNKGENHSVTSVLQSTYGWRIYRRVLNGPHCAHKREHPDRGCRTPPAENEPSQKPKPQMGKCYFFLCARVIVV